ncbi:MAG TPA: cation:proton antiporter [Jatrophihabitantaceae bacterium]
MLYADLGLVLALAWLFGQGLARVGLPAVMGELIAGVLLGPSLLGHTGWHFTTSQLVDLNTVGQLGVIALVGVTGMSLNLTTLRRRGRVAAWVSTTGVLVPLALGIGTGLLLPLTLLAGPSGHRAPFALFVGVAMCVSAIPVIGRILLDLRLTERRVGQLILIAGVIDGAIGWVLLSVVSAMASTGVRPGAVAVLVAKVVGALLVAVLVGRRVARLVLGLTGDAAAVVLILGGAAATNALGLEPILGAFVVGALVGAERPEAVSTLRPVVAVLAPVFFVLAGLKVDLGRLAQPPVLLAGLAVLTLAVVGKFVGAYAGARMSHLSRWDAIALGAGLNARGAVEVVVASTGLTLGVLNPASYTIIVLVAIVTSLMAAPVLRVAMARVDADALTGVEQEVAEPRTAVDAQGH